MLQSSDLGELTPENLGWVRCQPGASAADDVVKVYPGECSVRQCERAAAAGVFRSRGSSRRLQPYCELHAHERGVDVTRDGLAWSPEFVLTLPRRAR